MPELDIFNFLDYRHYLRESLRILKQNGQITGLREVAAVLDLKSPGHITWILQGKRDLASKRIPALAKLLNLNSNETRYLTLIVQYNDTTEDSIRKQLFTRISRMHASKKQKLGESYARFWTAPHHAALREIIGMGQYRDQHLSSLGKSLIPPLNAIKTLESVKLLQELKLIEKNKHGVWERCERVLSSGENWTTETIRSFQLSLMDQATRALVETPKENRDISTLTITMSPQIMEKVRKRLKELRQDILTMVRTDPYPQCVYHLTMQLFPGSVPMETHHG